MIIYNEKKVSD